MNICNKCLKKMNPKIKFFQINDSKGFSLYPYQDTIQNLLYRYKGCHDKVLSSIFFSPYKYLINLFFKTFIIVPVPSFYLQDKKRGFNHVEEMCKTLSLPIVNCLTKIKDIKQSSLNVKKRKEIYKYLKIKNKEFIRGKNILLIDDVLTTGNTLSSCIDLLKKAKVRNIFCLTMSYSCREQSEFGDENL